MMQQAVAPIMKAATPASHVSASVAPYAPSQDMLVRALDDDLTYSALYRLQNRAPLVFDKTFFDGHKKMAFARLHARDSQDQIVWIHPKLLSTLLYLCSRSETLAGEFLGRLRSGQVRGHLELKVFAAGNAPDGIKVDVDTLTQFLESIPARLAGQLKQFNHAERFRKAVESLPAGSMSIDEALGTLSALIEEYKLDHVAGATLAAIGRGILPVRQYGREIDVEARLLYAVASLVDPDLVERPSADDLGLAVCALKAERLGRLAGVLPVFKLDPSATLIADLAWAFRSIDQGESQLRTRMTQVEIVDAHLSNVSDARALQIILQDPAVTRHIADDDIADALMRLLGTSVFLREEVPYSAIPGLLTLAQRVLGARGIDKRITTESCRILSERTIKRDWLARAALVRRVRRYGQHARRRAA